MNWLREFPDFDPADVLTFDVNHRDTEAFFDEIPLNTNVKGAYTVISGEEPIDVRIIGPNRKQVFKRKGELNGFFEFNATERGEYEFSFSNRRFVGRKRVLVAVQIGKADADFVTAKELSPIEERLSDTIHQLKEVEVESKFAYKRQSVHYKTVREAHSRVYWAALLEGLCILGATGF